MEWKKYKNIDNDSNVMEYCIDYTSKMIGLKFGGSSKEYWYSSYSVGPDNFNKMCNLAELGDGLNAFINTTPRVKNGYLK